MTVVIILTIIAMNVYTSSHFFARAAVTAEVVPPLAKGSKNHVFCALFFLSFFLSITLPKAGRTISNVPITVADIFILLTLLCWLIQFLFYRKTTFTIPLFKSLTLFMLYGVVTFLTGFMNNNQSKSIILDFVAFIGFIPVYFLVCRVVHAKSQINNIVWAMVLSSFLICAYGVLQTQLGKRNSDLKKLRSRGLRNRMKGLSIKA